MIECKHINAMEDGYYNCMWCNDCGNYIEFDEYENIKGENMKEKDVFEFKAKIKVGIMWSIYTHLGLINDVDFSRLNDDTLDAYLEGSLKATTEKKRKDQWEKWYVGLMFEEKGFRGYIINKDKERLKEQLVHAMIDYRNPKFSIVEV